jgi:hypothetical protein
MPVPTTIEELPGRHDAKPPRKPVDLEGRDKIKNLD